MTRDSSPDSSEEPGPDAGEMPEQDRDPTQEKPSSTNADPPSGDPAKPGDTTASPEQPSAGRQLFRGASLYFAQTIFAAVLSLVALPLYTVFLTPEDFGIIAFATVFAGALKMLLTLGLEGSINRLYHDHKHDPRAVKDLCSTVAITLLVSVGGVGGLIAAFAGPAYHAALPDTKIPFSPYVQLAVIGIIAEQARMIPMALLRTQEKAGTLVALRAPISIGSLLARLAFIGWLGLGAYGWLLAVVLFDGLVAIPFVIWLLGFVRGARFSKQALKSSLGFGVPLVPHMAAHWSLNLADRIILERMVSVASLGVYGFGYQVARGWNDVNMAVAEAWAPMYYRLAHTGEAGHQALVRLQERLLGLLAIGSLVLSLAAPDVIRALTTERFHASAPIAALVLAAYAVHGMYTVFVVGIYHAKKTRLLPLATVTAALLNIVGNFLLIPRLGATGAAWATIAGYGFLAVVAVLLAQRVHPLPRRSPLGWIASVVVYAGAWSLSFVSGLPWWQTLLVKLAAVVAFVGWLTLLRALPTVSDVRTLLRKKRA